jgi:hypothetical protein
LPFLSQKKKGGGEHQISDYLQERGGKKALRKEAQTKSYQ